MPDQPPDLGEAAFRILLAFAAGPRHGYAVMAEVNARTEGALGLGPATLYSNIRRLLDAGLLAEVAAPRNAGSDDQRRRYYSTTQSGLRAIDRKLAQLEGMVAEARSLRGRKRQLGSEPA